MKDKLPINLEVLKWARTSIGYTIEDVAHRLKKDPSEIASWESGDGSPTYPQLESLAYELYKRPVALFFFPEVPKESSLKVEFRTLPDLTIERLPKEIIKAYRKAKLFQLNLAELYDEQKPIQNSILDRFELRPTMSFADVAQSIRSALNISIEEQYSWTSIDLAFKTWRKSLEDNGIFVFKDAFLQNEFSGFCIYDEKYPIIFVNNSMPMARQLFTLFHELGHLLLRSGGIDFYDRSIPEAFSGQYGSFEKLCNDFANNILVPDVIFDSFKLEPNVKNIENLAFKFSVSREVILRKLLDRRLINSNTYREYVRDWAEQANTKRSSDTGGNYHLTKKAYLGENYVNLAFSKYYQNKISSDTLSEILNIKPKNLDSFEHFAFARGDRD